MSRPQLPRDIIVLSTADWDNPFWTNKQHEAARLAAAGHRVLYMDSLGLRRPKAAGRDARRIFGRLSRAFGGVRSVRPGLWVVSPLVVPAQNRWSRWLNRHLARFQMMRAVRRLGLSQPLVWVYNPVTIDWLDCLSPEVLLYHCVDDLGAIPGVSAEAIRSAEAQLCQRAQVVVATSPVLAEKLEVFAPGKVHLLPNVVDFAHFAQARDGGALPADLAALPRPRIGFVGALVDYKVDFELIGAVAVAHPQWQWVLIGPVGEGQPDTIRPDCARLPNVHFLGPRSYDVLPDYLRGMDVAVLPMRSNAYTAAMFPMKFFEYLAARLPVVTTPLLALSAYEGLCFTASSPGDFAHALEAVLAGRRPDPRQCEAAARRHSWEWRLAEITRLVDEASASSLDLLCLSPAKGGL